MGRKKQIYIEDNSKVNILSTKQSKLWFRQSDCCCRENQLNIIRMKNITLLLTSFQASIPSYKWSSIKYRSGQALEQRSPTVWVSGPNSLYNTLAGATCRNVTSGFPWAVYKILPNILGTAQ